MINRRRNRRRSFLDKRKDFSKLGSGQTTRLLLGISVEKWSKYLFEDFKERYPDNPHHYLIDLLTETDVQIDEINSCHASTLDIKKSISSLELEEQSVTFCN